MKIDKRLNVKWTEEDLELVTEMGYFYLIDIVKKEMLEQKKEKLRRIFDEIKN